MCDQKDIEEEVSWTEDALKRVENAPDFVRPGIYRLMPMRARERNRKIITSEFLTEIRNESMMLVAKRIKGFGVETLSIDAFKKALDSMRGSKKKVEVIEDIRAFLEKRTKKNMEIIGRFRDYLEVADRKGMPWDKDAHTMLLDFPAPLRDSIRKKVEDYGKEKGYKVVTRSFLDESLRDLSIPLSPEMDIDHTVRDDKVFDKGHEKELEWTEDVRRRIQAIPIPPIRRKIIKAIEEYAHSNGLHCIDSKIMDRVIKENNLLRKINKF